MNMVKYLTRLSCPAITVIVVFSFLFSAGGRQLPSPDEVLAILAEGNQRFATDHPAYPHAGTARRTEVVNGQHPLATLISCSDSRVPPEMLFDAGIGDLFIIRVIGNISSRDQIGSAEYGVEHLGTPILLVMGHSGCGAVTAAVTNAKVHGSIPPVLANIRPAVLTAAREHPELKGAELIPEVIRANVFFSMENLLTRSQAIRSQARSGKIKVVGAIYDLQTGQVEWLGSHPRQDQILANRGTLKGPPKTTHREKPAPSRVAPQ